MGALAIARKEITLYFTTMIAYVVIGLFLLINGFMFVQLVGRFMQFTMQAMQQPQMSEQLNVTYLITQPLVLNMGVFLVFFIPALTMRLIAEEKRQKTYELLMTTPIGLWDIVLGKYLAAMFVLTVMIGLTFAYPLLVNLYSADSGGVAWSTVLSAYLGLFLVGAVFVAIGLFCSSVTENQIVAAILALAALLLLWIINWAATSADDGTVKAVLQHISVLDHLQNFTAGLIELKSLVYLIGAAFFGLFLTHKVLETQRYAGI